MVSRSLKVLLLVNAVVLVAILFSATGRAQRPPATTPDGIPYFNVNINPTEIPPMVNINPNGYVPRVTIGDLPKLAISELPEVHTAAAGCGDRRNFLTAIGRSIQGPMVLTYLNVQAPTITLSSPQEGTRKITMAGSTQVATGIYLRAGQRMDFDQDILYSGCIPQ